MARCTLHLGKHLVLIASDGAPEVEYALFDPGEIELQATRPGTIREVGYRTTAAEARARLAALDLTAVTALEVAAAVKPGVARTYARGPTVRSIVDSLEGIELFEGGTFDAGTGRYAGTWLDLAALAADVDVPSAGASVSATLQGLHLAALLADSGDDEPVVLATAEVTALRRPGERTHKRVNLDDPRRLVQALGALRPPSGRGLSDNAPSLREILERLHESALRAPAAAPRLRAIENVLATREMPARGPLADAELWGIEASLSEGDASRTIDQLDALERRRGRLPGTTYLRERAALLTPGVEPRTVAERVSELSTSMPNFHELELLAAQAWAAAGDTRRAKAFARDLVDNAGVSSAIRVQALAILDAADSGSSGRQRTALPAADASRVPEPPLGPTVVEPRPMADTAPASTGRPSARSLPAGASLPPHRAEPPGERSHAPSAPLAHSMDPERAEALSPPPGLPGEAPPPSDEPPQTPTAARLAFTFLARELGRELRMRHGVELQTDVDGLEQSQRYLREALMEGRVRTAEERREVMRHGAFLSELLARRLGARWVDVESPDPGRWAMVVPSALPASENLRVWPFGRVLRFVVMGHKERDLVSYYLDLEARAR